MEEKILKGISIALLVLLFCSAWGLGRAAEPPALARLSGAEKERVLRLIEGAKKERELLGYSAVAREDFQPLLISKFREEYGLSEADLQIKIVPSRTGAITTKVTEELRAKVYKTDIVQNIAIGWFNDLIAKGELMAYDSPEYKHFSPLSADPNISPANPPYFISSVYATYGIVYNPKYVKGEIVHWKDVLRPEYKGKVSCGDVTNSFSYTDGYLALVKVIGASFFKELAKQNPFLLVSGVDLNNKAISGEFPIVVFSSQGPAFRANLRGAGLKLVFPPEGWPTGGNQMAILAHAPHPNASKLFIDFFHSAFAQKIVMEEGGYPVGRLGLKSKYSDYPVPIYDLKGYIEMDWRKITDRDRDNAREEFRRLVIEKK